MRNLAWHVVVKGVKDSDEEEEIIEELRQDEDWEMAVDAFGTTSHDMSGSCMEDMLAHGVWVSSMNPDVKIIAQVTDALGEHFVAGWHGGKQFVRDAELVFPNPFETEEN